MEFIDVIIESYNIPVLTAFLLGVLTSISPCPLATNITAVAYISKEIKTAKNTLLNGLFYTLGRGISYSFLAVLIYFGLSSFRVAEIFQGWGDVVLGPVLISIGLVMFGFIKIKLGQIGGERFERLKDYLSRKGFMGSLVLGILFALAFCPYSGVLFFGGLMPLVLNSTGGIFLPPVFALGTGIPVIMFSFLLAFSLQKVSHAFKVVQRVERVMRYLVATVFIVVGIYYLQYLVGYLAGLFW